MLESTIELIDGLCLITVILLASVSIVGSIVAALRAADRGSTVSNVRRKGLSALLIAVTAFHFLVFVPSALAISPAERTIGNSQQWSLRVDKVDTGDVGMDPSLDPILRKQLLRELAKTKRFKEVVFGGDRSARRIPDVLILKMTVREGRPGSATPQANPADAGVLGAVAGGFLRLCGWGGVTGVDKLNARIQLYTGEGRLVLDNVVEGNVAFTGDNSRAIHNLVHNVAVTLQRSRLPDSDVMVASEKEAGQTVSIAP